MVISRRMMVSGAAGLLASGRLTASRAEESRWISRNGAVDGGPGSGFFFGTLDGEPQAWTAHNAGRPYSCRVWPSTEAARVLRLELRAGEQWPDEARLGGHEERTLVQATTTRDRNVSQALPMYQAIWWRFSFLVEHGPPITAVAPGYGWVMFADIHSDWNASHAHAVPIQFGLRPDDFVVIQIHGTLLHPDNAPNIMYRTDKPLRRGVWHGMVVRLVMDPLGTNGGAADVYLDGSHVLHYSGSVGFVGDRPYPQFQIYRGNPNVHRIEREAVAIRYANHEIVTSGRL